MLTLLLPVSITMITLQIIAVAAIIHQINPLRLFVLLIFIILMINGTLKVTDMFVWIVVLLATANTAMSVKFLLNFWQTYARLLYGCTAQQNSNSKCHALRHYHY